MTAATGRMHRDPLDTERQAAQSIDAASLRVRVLELLRAHPDGLTDDEGAALLHGQIGYGDRLTFGRRRQELCAAGLAEGTHERRATPGGRWAIVWRAAPDQT